MQKVSFSALFRGANPDALDLLDKMLAFDPSSRISVEQALEHKYLQIWHDASDEPTCPTPFDFHFEVVEDVNQMKKMIVEEVRLFRQSVRGGHGASMSHGGGQAPGAQVPMPQDNDFRYRQEDPRPQEAGAGAMNGLEQDLQGLDGMRS